MKRMQKFVRCLGSVTLAILIACSPLCIQKASAGASDIIIDSSSFQESLDENIWNVPNGDVYAESGKILFDSNSADGSRIITRRAVVLSKQHKDLFRAEYIVKLNKLEGESKLLFLFGLDSIEANYAEPGNIELVIQNQDGLQASLVTWDDMGVETVLGAAQKISGDALKISAFATDDNHFTLTVNGTAIYDAVMEADLTGRIGIGLTGPAEAEISKADIISHRYETPENTNISEDFERGTINTNTLYSVMTSACNGWPASLVVEKYDGNQVLMFRNVSSGSIGTVHQYSNVEISFDIPYVLYRSVMREDGTALQNAHQGFVVSFGDEVDVHTGLGFNVSPEAVMLAPTSISRYKDSSQSVNLEGMGYFSKENNTGYSVKIRLVDRQVTVYAKSLEAETYDELMTYNLGNITPQGYVHVWSQGVCNAAIDNLVITNLDQEPNLIELDYMDGFLPEAEDWVYQPMEVVYRDVEQNVEGSQFPVAAIVEIAAGVVIAAVGVLAYLLLKKKAKKGASAE